MTLEKPTNLTPRAKEVLSQLLEGLTEKEVGLRMGISAHTVHVYVKRIYRHYQVSSRPALLCLCFWRSGQQAIGSGQ